MTITTPLFQETLKVSDSTAERILNEMEKTKQIQQVGEFKATYYRLPSVE